jgi:hypothetical protein
MKIKDQRLSALISVISVPFAARIGQAVHAGAIVGQDEVGSDLVKGYPWRFESPACD